MTMLYDNLSIALDLLNTLQIAFYIFIFFMILFALLNLVRVLK